MIIVVAPESDLVNMRKYVKFRAKKDIRETFIRRLSVIDLRRGSCRNWSILIRHFFFCSPNAVDSSLDILSRTSAPDNVGGRVLPVASGRLVSSAHCSPPGADRRELKLHAALEVMEVRNRYPIFRAVPTYYCNVLIPQKSVS